ncbi:MAG: hypothetical protein M5U26_25315 [Planctomycetota bacterium]|nr:hypothetical protein [Planctomycetota bacterium]
MLTNLRRSSAPLLALGLALAAWPCAARDQRLLNTFVFESDGKVWQLTFTKDDKYILQTGDGKRVDGTYVSTDDEVGLNYPEDARARRHFAYGFVGGILNLAVTGKNRPSEAAHALNDLPPARDRATWLTRTDYEALVKERTETAAREREAQEAAARAAKEEAERRERDARETAVRRPVPGGPRRPGWENDPKPPENLPTPLLALYDEVRADVDYRRHREAADRAFLAGDWEAAQAHYEAAAQLKHDDEAARQRLAATGGWLAMLKGDAARDRGDWKAAKEEYHRAVVLWPALRPLYGQKIASLSRARQGRPTGEPGVTLDATEANLETRVLALIQQQKYDEAAKIADAATVLHPESAALLSLEDGVANFEATRGHVGRLQALLARTAEQARQAAAYEPRAELAAKTGTRVADLDARARALPPAARDMLLRKDYARLKEQPEQARALTGALRDDLLKWQTEYARKAQAERDAGDLDLGIFRVKRNKETEASRKFDEFAAGWSALAEDAAALLKE